MGDAEFPSREEKIAYIIKKTNSSVVRGLPKAIPENAHVIVAISDTGKCLLIRILDSAPHWVIEGIKDFDIFEEAEYFVEHPGLYYAEIVGHYCGGGYCRGYECPGDCFEMDFNIIKEKI